MFYRTRYEYIASNGTTVSRYVPLCIDGSIEMINRTLNGFENQHHYRSGSLIVTSCINRCLSDDSMLSVCKSIIEYEEVGAMRDPYAITIIDVDIESPITQREYITYLQDLVQSEGRCDEDTQDDKYMEELLISQIEHDEYMQELLMSDTSDSALCCNEEF